jgi:hypothetical protein
MYQTLKDNIQSHFLSVNYSKMSNLAIIKMAPSEKIRLYSQSNTAFISEDSVKPPGLLSYLVKFIFYSAIQSKNVHTTTIS